MDAYLSSLDRKPIDLNLPWSQEASAPKRLNASSTHRLIDHQTTADLEIWRSKTVCTGCILRAIINHSEQEIWMNMQSKISEPAIAMTFCMTSSPYKMQRKKSVKTIKTIKTHQTLDHLSSIWSSGRVISDLSDGRIRVFVRVRRRVTLTIIIIIIAFPLSPCHPIVTSHHPNCHR